MEQHTPACHQRPAAVPVWRLVGAGQYVRCSNRFGHDRGPGEHDHGATSDRCPCDRDTGPRWLQGAGGRVASVSADALTDPVTRKPYYDVRVGLRADEMHKLGAKDLIPGMPVEAFLATESRTPMNYVLRPILTYFDRAFRDS